MRQKGGWTLLVISLAVIISVMTLYLYRAVNQEVKEWEHTQKDIKGMF